MSQKSATFSPTPVTQPPNLQPKSASFSENKVDEKKEQMAGHAGGFVFFGDGSLAKKTEPVEISFYQESDKFRKLKNSGKVIPQSYGSTLFDFIEFVPKYFGMFTPPGGESEKPMLRMEDLAGKFKKPAIVDLKIGSKLFEDGAKLQKKVHNFEKSNPIKIGKWFD
ncbi:hypothetical protein HK096_002216 [Nowakowskiella sp. JEL0078]|nr:hypothetical protein HK096_002216 [Nowakowskiella sp. JEL0078]